MINKATQLSNIEWIYSNNGSFVIPVVKEYDILKGKNVFDIGLGEFDKVLSKIDTSILSDIKLPYEQREKFLIELIKFLLSLYSSDGLDNEYVCLENDDDKYSNNEAVIA